jgi:hypothetical protein
VTKEYVLRNLWDTVMHTNVCIRGISEREERKGQTEYLKEQRMKHLKSAHKDMNVYPRHSINVKQYRAKEIHKT